MLPNITPDDLRLAALDMLAGSVEDFRDLRRILTVLPAEDIKAALLDACRYSQAVTAREQQEGR